MDILGSFFQLFFKKQHASGKQLKIDSFFQSTRLHYPSAIK
jgi:hypothetical protein